MDAVVFCASLLYFVSCSICTEIILIPNQPNSPSRRACPPLPSSPHSCPHYLHPVHQCPRSPPRSISLFFIGIYWQIFLLAPKAIPRLWPGSIVDTQFLLSAINHVFCLKSIACGRSTWQSSYWESRRLCRHAPLGDECVCVVYLYAITVCVMSICTCACVCAMSVCVCVCGDEVTKETVYQHTHSRAHTHSSHTHTVIAYKYAHTHRTSSPPHTTMNR